MARGLDQLEGEVLEAIVIFAVVLLIVFGFIAWRGAAGFPAAALLSFIRKFWNAIDSLFAKAVESLSPGLNSPISGTAGRGVDEAHTGTSTMSDSPTTDYTSPAGSELSMYDQQESQ
jgi:hypothetical protein